MMVVQLFLLLVIFFVVNGAGKPPVSDKAATAHWLVHSSLYGTLSTSSLRLGGQAWGQVKSFVDGTSDNSTGNIYLYDSELDASIQDAAVNPLVSFSLSSVALGLCPVSLLDPESPLWLETLSEEGELSFAREALFQRHPAMADWPANHNWKTFKVVLSDLWLVDVFGGASIIPVSEYYAAQ